MQVGASVVHKRSFPASLLYAVECAPKPGMNRLGPGASSGLAVGVHASNFAWSVPVISCPLRGNPNNHSQAVVPSTAIPWRRGDARPIPMRVRFSGAPTQHMRLMGELQRSGAPEAAQTTAKRCRHT